MANRLVQSSSPYLQLHADNPVDWFEWGPEAFEEARRRDVPVLVSVGYLACHWCHVMARETFSDPKVAAKLNEHYVAIKVDREERPDVDQALMRVTQALTGQGGWPMTVILTPDAQPFFAGTYFPPEPRDRQPSFTQFIDALASAWESRRAEVLESADTIVLRLQGMDHPPIRDVEDRKVAPTRLVTDVHAQYDSEHGGFMLGAPKFPQPALLDALFVRSDQMANDRALYTLDCMARGGIHDWVGGGFHRYAVDAGWEVPHFEKMLSDNALLLGTYTRGFLRATPDDGTEQHELFTKVASGIVGWMQQMQLPSGALASSQSAESLDEQGNSVEGAYYLWTPAQLDEVLGKDSRFAQGVFHVTFNGNMPSGAHAPTDGSGRSTLQYHGLPHPGRMERILATLREARSQRPAPAVDDKVITAWNGLAVESLVRAAIVFGHPQWLELATGIAGYLWQVHWDGQERLLARSSVERAGEFLIGSDGGAGDYASAVIGFLALGGALGDAVWIKRAVELMDRAVELFHSGDGGFHDSMPDETLFERPRRYEDDAMPSATSMMVVALRQVAELTGRRELAERADAAAMRLRHVLVANPVHSGWGLADLLSRSEAAKGTGPAQIVVVDDSGDVMGELNRAAWRLAPWGSLVVRGPAGATGFGTLFDNRTEIDGPAAYICRDQVCVAPITQWADLREILWPHQH